MWKIISLLILLIPVMVGCMPQIPPAFPAQPITVGRQVIDDDFDTPGRWDQYDHEDLRARVENGAYTLLLRSRSGYNYLWGLNHQQHTDIVLESAVTFEGGYERSIAGIMCRASRVNSRAYYFLISANGAFSIRRGLEQSTEPLVQWQSHSAIYTDGRRNILRAICRGDYLGFYVNGVYLDGAEDDRYQGGVAGLVVKVSDGAAEDDFAQARFDYLRGWEAGS